ncbi:MAG: hypothetical protein Q9170_003037 [Blastenia crenularia]
MAICAFECPFRDDLVFETRPWKPPSIQPNPDISGLGVINPSLSIFCRRGLTLAQVLIGFMATAYFTLLLVFVYYIIGWSTKSHLNVIDIGLLRWLHLKTKLHPARSWEPVLRKAILLFADQQLITGFAILGASYSQLRCGISSYHWQIIIYLAWLTSLSHLTTLTALRQYFQEHHTIRAWRIALMLCMAFPLCVALLPTGHGRWSPGYFNGVNNDATPAICMFKLLALGKFETGLFSTPAMVLSLFVLSLGYVTRIVKLFPDTAATVRKWLRTKPGDVVKRWLDSIYNRSRTPGAGKLWTLVYILSLALFLDLRVICDLNDSILWEVSEHTSFSKIGEARLTTFWCFLDLDAMVNLRVGMGFNPSISFPRHEWSREKRLEFWAMAATYNVGFAHLKSKSAVAR